MKGLLFRGEPDDCSGKSTADAPNAPDKVERWNDIAAQQERSAKWLCMSVSGQFPVVIE